jgi:UDP:flavonoid glycosyltransferase YjiC (YdhE family)
MRITILTIGSRGDTQPFIALGVRLQQAGYDVLLAAPPDFACMAETYGLPFRAIGGQMQALLSTPEARAVIESGDKLKALRWRQANRHLLFDSMFEDAWKASQGTDGIIYKNAVSIGASIAEKLRVPCVEAGIMPLTPTREFPPVLLNASKGWGRFQPVVNWLGSSVSSQLVMWQAVREAVNTFRRERLGLKPYPFFGPVAQQGRAGMPLLYAYSPLVVPRPLDWPENVHVTGYWFLDAPAHWQPPQSLVDFLQAGPPPVYIGFGSMPQTDPRQTIQMFLKALEQTRQRGILLKGWSGLDEAGKLPDSVYLIDSVPHSWLFPQVAAVVHHGGAGTTAATLWAGVPSIFVPHFGDQPFWAARVQELGCAPAAISRHHLTADHLARGIQEAVTNAAMRQRAAELGRAIRAEKGVENAVRCIEMEMNQRTLVQRKAVVPV